MLGVVLNFDIIDTMISLKQKLFMLLKYNLTCCKMLVLVSVLLNFEMLQHLTFPTKFAMRLSIYFQMDGAASELYFGGNFIKKDPKYDVMVL